MESYSDSDSKEDSVIEKSDVLLNDSKVQKKEKFKAFCKTQKTICADSSVDDEATEDKSDRVEDADDESEAKFLFEEVLDELKLPASPEDKNQNWVVMKTLKTVTYEKDDGKDSTENSECSGDDNVSTENYLDKPEIIVNFNASSVSHVVQRNESNIEEQENEACINEQNQNTSEDEDSALNLSNQGDGENEDEQSIQRSDTEESDIMVSDLDYYKIRHETEVVEDHQFCVSITDVQLYTNYKNEPISVKRYSVPHINIMKPKDNDTSDEEINCLDSDFMTREEFMDAHRTNYDLPRKQLSLMVSHSFSEKTDDDSDQESTESLKESIDSDSLDELCSEEDEQTFNEIEHSPGCVHSTRVLHSRDCKFMTFIKGLHCNNDEDIIIEKEVGDETDCPSETEKSAAVEMTDTDHTNEEILSDMEDESKKPMIDKQTCTNSELESLVRRETGVMRTSVSNGALSPSSNRAKQSKSRKKRTKKHH